MIGTTLAHFKITAKLGEGGMGEVYRAEDTKLGREVAGKVLPEEFASDSERLARFEREAKLLASLNHPNIAAVYEVDLAGETQFLVMEFVDGETLQERLSRGPLSVEQALKIAIQLATGLESAHNAGIIHRDLKPANIKITPTGEVLILDFGVAKAMGPTGSDIETQAPTLTAYTIPGALIGTPAYMSPEQVTGRPSGRHLGLRLRALRDADRPATVQGRHTQREPGSGCSSETRLGAASRQVASHSTNSLAALSAQGSQREVARHRGRANGPRRGAPARQVGAANGCATLPPAAAFGLGCRRPLGHRSPPVARAEVAATTGRHR